MRALDDIVVLEVCSGIAGSLCALQLADAGADVIKVELPPAGDAARQLEPAVGGISSLFLLLNRDKRSVAVNYRSGDGLKVLLKLVGKADVVVVDFQPAETRRIGLSYASFQQANPQIVYCSITPFGEEGPYADLPASELEVQGLSGVMWFMGEHEKPPVRVGADIASGGAAMCGFIGITAALYSRMLSGQGQKVSVSLLGALLSMNSHWMADFSDPDDFNGALTRPYEQPATGYQTKDRPLTFGFYGRRSDRANPWHAFCKAVGLEELLLDPWIREHGASMVGVGKDAQEMKPILENAFTRWSSDDLMRIIGEIGAGGGPFMSYADLYSEPLHPQVQATGAIKEVPHPMGGSFRAVLSPWATPTAFGDGSHIPPPRLGAHTVEVLKRIGYSDAFIRRLQEEGVVC